MRTWGRAATVHGSALLALSLGLAASAQGAGREPDPLWKLYESTLASAKYIEI